MAVTVSFPTLNRRVYPFRGIERRNGGQLEEKSEASVNLSTRLCQRYKLPPEKTVMYAYSDNRVTGTGKSPSTFLCNGQSEENQKLISYSVSEEEEGRQFQ